LYDHDTDSLRFHAATSERVRITNAGNLGIGTTSPTERLVVVGNVTIQDSIKAYGFVNFTNNTAFNQTLYLVNGNVGIGTTSPQNALDVVGAVTVSRGLNASNLNVTGFSITDDSLVTVVEFNGNIPQEIEVSDDLSHIPNISYTPENQKNSGGFSYETR
jgi:hypothetical protein